MAICLFTIGNLKNIETQEEQLFIIYTQALTFKVPENFSQGTSAKMIANSKGGLQDLSLSLLPTANLAADGGKQDTVILLPPQLLYVWGNTIHSMYMYSEPFCKLSQTV